MKKWVKITLLVVIALVLMAGLFLKIYFNYPLPQYEGELTLTELQEPVEVFFDDYAVPHIFAKNEHDLFFVAGYLVARERLFQMTVTAASTEGRLAELFGESVISSDIYLRTWGIPKAAAALAENMHPESKAISKYFCDGVNTYIANTSSDLPVEFKLLGIKPFQWQPKHITGYARMMAHNLSFSWRTEILLSRLMDGTLSQRKVRDLWPRYPEGQPLIKPPGKLYSLLGETMSDEDHKLRKIIQMDANHLGSNNFVISGSRTATGAPILANDPHLPFSQPPVWYEMHLSGGRFNVSGVTLPGMPVIILGQNEAAAWGFTNLMVDDIDFYKEIISPEDPNLYFYDGEYKPMTVWEETISVKGGEDSVVVFRETVHGPVVSDLHPQLKGSDKVVSMRWVGHDTTSDEMYAAMKLNLMSSWEDFQTAGELYSAPAQNVVYADTSGNIGWRPFGWIPMRAKGDELVPVDGSDPGNDWSGFVPDEEIPVIFNPENGLIITANNKVVDDSYPHYISSFWEDPSRAMRLWEILDVPELITMEYAKDAMVDVTSPFAREVAAYFVSAFSDSPPEDDKNLRKAVELLSGWNGDHSPSSRAATVFNTSLIHLFENLFADELNLLGDDAYESWLSFPPLSLRSTRFILKNSQSSVWDDVTTPGKVETMDEILRKSLTEGVRDIEELVGPDPNIWAWSRLHTLTHLHSIGRESSILNWLFGFNVGPFETGGNSTTVNNGEYRLSAPYDHINGPSKRRAVDMNDLNNTQIVLPTGQSGLPKNVHYSDQAELFNAGQYRTTLFDEEEIRKAGFRKLVLIPKD